METKKDLRKIKENKKQLESSDLNVGDFLINDNGELLRIEKIKKREIFYEYRWEGKWNYYGSGNVEEVKSKYIKIDIKHESEYEKYQKEILQEAINPNLEEEDETQSESKEIMTFDKNYIIGKKKQLEKIKDKFAIMERMLNKKRNHLQNIVSNFEKKISKVMKVLFNIELYLGIEEEIFQIQSGEVADINTPLSLRQQILFMDEEVGVAEHEDIDYQGIDFEEIEKFDEWLIKNNNYKKMLPEEKGIVIFRIRRKDKDYGTRNTYNEWVINQENKQTYFLIRNGENIYRIWSSLKVHDRLFPKQEELKEIMKDIEEDRFQKDNAENTMLMYSRNILIIQGLLDRTQIFKPFPPTIKLFKPDTWGKKVNYIYDDELTLPDGRKSYDKWKDSINKQIVQGTRIYFAGFSFRDLDRKNGCGYDDYRFTFNPPSEPKEGIYTVLNVNNTILPLGYKSRGDLHCNFKSDEPVYDYYDQSERKKAIPFYLDKNDWFVLNYDLLDLEDIEFYIHSRIERSNYLDILPTLIGIKRQRLAEIEWEKGFVDNLKLKLKCDEEKIWFAIDWWKNKVKWKRPIMKEDAKALRMIESKIKKKGK